MTETAALIALTLLVGALVGIVIYALLRFGAAARAARRGGAGNVDPALLTSAVQDAVTQLRDKGRRLEARAEASERLSVQIVASMASGLLLVDADGRLRLGNPAALQLLGLQDVDGHYATRLAHVPELRDVIDGALTDGQPVMRRTVRGADTAVGPSRLGVTVSPVRAADGSLQSVVCVFTDLTTVLALEEQLRVKDTLARLGELTAGMAHEFRNGLATIHGYARLMEPAVLPAPCVTYLEGIRAETDALREVVTNFLNFARPAPLTVTDVDLRALAERALDEVRAEVEGRGGSVAVEGDFRSIQGDEVMLRQALSNLCRNAAEACRLVDRPPRITITARYLGDQAACRLTVADNGPGIQAAALGKMFQPFFTTRSSGTGLGLALVQKIVVTHNGQIGAARGDNGGAVFEVTLPLHQTRVPPARDPAGVPATDRGARQADPNVSAARRP